MVAWGRSFVASSSASLPFLGSRWSSGTMRGDRMPLPLQRNPIHSSISIFFCISKWSLFLFWNIFLHAPRPFYLHNLHLFSLDWERVTTFTAWPREATLKRILGDIVAQSSLLSFVPSQKRFFSIHQIYFLDCKLICTWKISPKNYTKSSCFQL